MTKTPATTVPAHHGLSGPMWSATTHMFASYGPLVYVAIFIIVIGFTFVYVYKRVS